MTTNLLESVAGQLTPQMIRRVGTSMGETPAHTQKAVDGAILSLLAGLMHVTASEDGPTRLVNLINRMPPERFRHCIICFSTATDFRNRLNRVDVPIFELGKRDGKDLKVLFRLWRLLIALRPDIVHTRNLATLEAQVPAMLAGVARRVHGEQRVPESEHYVHGAHRTRRGTCSRRHEKGRGDLLLTAMATEVLPRGGRE